MRQVIEQAKRRRLRRKTYVWMLSGLAVVSALLYWDQIAVLYIVSTLVLTALLLAVAFSDLGRGERELPDPDTVAMGENRMPPGASSQSVSNPRKNRRKGKA